MELGHLPEAAAFYLLTKILLFGEEPRTSLQEAAKAALVNATAVVNKAASKGVYHKNNAARKISRLAKAVNEMA